MTLIRYTNQLDGVDPIALGEQLYREGKTVDEVDPTAPYLMEDHNADFLHEFYRKVDVGWYRARNAHNHQQFLAQLPAFQAAIPAVGEEVYITFPNVPDKQHRCRIEFIPPERDQVLIRLFETKKSGYPEQSALRLVGYEYPGRFPTFSAEQKKN